MNKPVGVIDLGSARTKLLIATPSSPQPQIENFKFETKLGSYLADDTIAQQGLEALEDSLNECFKKFAERQVGNYVIVATEVFRRAAREKDDWLESLEEKFGKISLLDHVTEGAVFYMSIADSLQGIGGSICLADIGGGSVQLIWKSGSKIEVKSIKTGTFLLENTFQKEFPPTPDELHAMEQFIREELTHIGPPPLDIDLLVFGSNCMEDFIKESTQHAGIRIDEPNMPLDKIESLYDSIKGKDFDTVKEYYKSNQFFMYGADKALANLLNIAKWLGVSKARPTNGSLSLGMAQLLLTNKESLTNIGIKVNDL